MSPQQKHVLVAPLDWGLGHATRCIPLIGYLLKSGIQVSVAASGYGKKLLAERFPGLHFEDIPGISIRYPQKGSMALAMLSQWPAINKAIRVEKETVNRIIPEKKITHIISDNRYGLFSEKIKCAFMTHQIHIDGGKGWQFAEPWLFRMHRKRIEKFNELWIPDNPEINLSGKLSNAEGISIPVKYTGLLSRFQNPAKSSEKKYDCIAVLSGPEPQRTIFEFKVMQYFSDASKKYLVILGQPGNPVNTFYENITVKASISDEEFSELLHPETLLICRPGYSTLMDLALLKHRKVLFVPTPGQTEQEYLAGELQKKFQYSISLQHDVFPGLNEIISGKEIVNGNNQSLLEKTTGAFLA